MVKYMLERWTGGECKSTSDRVINIGDAHGYLAFFFENDLDYLIRSRSDNSEDRDGSMLEMHIRSK